MVGTVMDMPNIEVIRHWVAWGPSAECPDGYMEHSTERVEQFQAWLELQRDQCYASGVLDSREFHSLKERERIIKLLETEIVNSVTWQAQNRYWNEEWNGGQDSDNQYIQSIAGSLIALIKGENK